MRAVQFGISFDDLFKMRKGEVLDLFVESGNDRAKYAEFANQNDIDHFFD